MPEPIAPYTLPPRPKRLCSDAGIWNPDAHALSKAVSDAIKPVVAEAMKQFAYAEIVHVVLASITSEMVFANLAQARAERRPA